MMRRFFGLFKQDLTLALRNTLMPVLIFLILVMAVMVRFVLPKEWKPVETYYFVDRTEDGLYEWLLRQSGIGAHQFLSDEGALRSAVGEKGNSIGVLFAGPTTHPEITIMHSERVSAQGLNILKATLNAIVERATEGTQINEGMEQPSNVKFLRPQARPVAPNLTSVPGLLAFEVLVLGFTFVAVFIFQERSEGTIRAYRVSPGGTGAYILSKTLVFIVLGTLYGCGLVLSTMGLSVNYGVLVPLTALGVGLYTLIGISVASFFKDLSEWFLPGVLLLMLNMMPVVSLLFPTFSPRWLTYIPSYPVTFALSEVLFPSGKPLLPLVGVLGGETVAAYVICVFLTERNLMKEGRS